MADESCADLQVAERPLKWGDKGTGGWWVPGQGVQQAGIRSSGKHIQSDPTGLNNLFCLKVLRSFPGISIMLPRSILSAIGHYFQ